MHYKKETEKMRRIDKKKVCEMMKAKSSNLIGIVLADLFINSNNHNSISTKNENKNQSGAKCGS